MWRSRVLLAIIVSFGAGVSVGKQYAERRMFDKKSIQKRLVNAETNDINHQHHKQFYNRAQISVNASTPELISYWGYPSETHQVETKDGYVLTLHRIPHGRTNADRTRPVVLLQHGLLCSSADWVINPPYQGFGYVLADAGYDVWLGNARGNTYSRRHISLSPEDPKFWEFSWDEMGDIDMPAQIDYILKETGQKALYYVGHSMGTTIFWVMMNKHPEYNHKILAMFALAPVAYVDHIKSVWRMFTPLAQEFDELTYLVSHGEFMPNGKAIRLLAKWGCDLNRMEEKMCENVLFLFSGGFNPKNFNTSMVPWILGHTPAGTSSHTVVHYSQIIKSKKFRAYDYGTKGNYEHYNQQEPPDYNLEKVTAPVVAFWGPNDWLAPPKDVLRTVSELGNVVKSVRVPDGNFNHIDFLYGINTRRLVYDEIVKIMPKFILKSKY